MFGFVRFVRFCTVCSVLFFLAAIVTSFFRVFYQNNSRIRIGTTHTVEHLADRLHMVDVYAMYLTPGIDLRIDPTGILYQGSPQLIP